MAIPNFFAKGFFNPETHNIEKQILNTCIEIGMERKIRDVAHH